MSLENRLVFALLWLGFCAVPAVCYVPPDAGSRAPRWRLVQAEGQVRARLVATMQTEQQAHARLVAILEATPDLVAINDIQRQILLSQSGRARNAGIRRGDSRRITISADNLAFFAGD